MKHHHLHNVSRTDCEACITAFRLKRLKEKHLSFGGRLNVEYPNKGWNVPNLLEALKTAERKQKAFTWPRILGKYAIGILIAIGTYILFDNL